jgi:hypothetical protein
MSETMVVDVDGVRVEGEVERSRRQIDLRIVSPYQGLRAGLHIAVFIPIPPAPDFTEAPGEAYAAQMLRELYQVGKYIEENKESLRERAKEFDAAIARLDPEKFLTEDNFRAFRRGVRAQLRSGTIDIRSYERQLVQARKKRKAHKEEVWRLENEFFSANFPMGVPGDDVLAILRSPA